MGKLPKVDILIISYNQEAIIAETIESVLNQTYKNTNIIIADDFSTDKTREIINKISVTNPNRITKVFNDRNLGITKNSNKGLEASSGEFFIIMGGDDILYPSKVEEQINWFKRNPDYHLCGHNLDLINEKSEKTGVYFSKPIKSKGLGAESWIKQGMLFGCLSVMIKKDNSFLIKFDEKLKYSSDLKFFIDFLSDNKKFGYLPKTLGAYRKTENSITERKWKECVDDSIKMYKILKTDNSNFKKEIMFGETYLNDYGNALRNFRLGDRKEAAKGFIKVIKKEPFFLKPYFRLLQSIFS